MTIGERIKEIRNRIKKNIIDEGLEKSVRGDIIIPYCDYMIDAIEKKKSAIE